MATTRRPARADLHIHTPAGGDYRGDPCTSTYQIVSTCANKGLDLVVLADHMTLAPMHTLQTAAQPTEPCVLWGTELKVGVGADQLHIIVVFDPRRAATSFSLLMEELRPFVGGNGTPSSIELKADPAFVTGAARAVDALCVAAHVDRLPGGHDPMSNQALLRLVHGGLVHAVEYDDPATATAAAKRIPVPCVTSSDAHSLEEIGRRWTELRLEEASFEGLRHALGQPGGTVVRRVAQHAAAMVQS